MFGPSFLQYTWSISLGGITGLLLIVTSGPESLVIAVSIFRPAAARHQLITLVAVSVIRAITQIYSGNNIKERLVSFIIINMRVSVLLYL